MKSSEHLIDYLVVDVDKMPLATIKKLVQKAQNRPYELRGEQNTEFLFSLFLRLRQVASEIIYRPAEQTPDASCAFIISSHLNSAAILRPFHVGQASTFSETELKQFDQSQVADTTTKIQIDLAAWNPSSVHAFLRHLYATNQTKIAVEMQGQTSPLLILLTLNWFYSPTTRFVLNGSPIR